MENESCVVWVSEATNLLKVSYCLVVSPLFLYQLQIDIIQPISFSLLIWTSLLQLHTWCYVIGARGKHWRCVTTLYSLHPPSSSPAWCRQGSVPPVVERASYSALSSWHYRGGRRRNKNSQGWCRVGRVPWVPHTLYKFWKQDVIVCYIILVSRHLFPRNTNMARNSYSFCVWKSYMSNFSCMLFRIPT